MWSCYQRFSGELLSFGSFLFRWESPWISWLCPFYCLFLGVSSLYLFSFRVTVSNCLEFYVQVSVLIFLNYLKSDHLHCRKLSSGSYLPINNGTVSVDSQGLRYRCLDRNWKYFCVINSIYWTTYGKNECSFFVGICALCFNCICYVFLHAWNHRWYCAELIENI